MRSEADGFGRGYGIGRPQRVRFAAKVELFSSPLSIPCLKPLMGNRRCRYDNSESSGAGAAVRWTLGYCIPLAPSSPLVGAGVFNAGVMDGKLRAIDVENGELLYSSDQRERFRRYTHWSYTSPTSGDEYVLVLEPAGGGRPDREEDYKHGRSSISTHGGGKVIARAR